MSVGTQHERGAAPRQQGLQSQQFRRLRHAVGGGEVTGTDRLDLLGEARQRGIDLAGDGLGGQGGLLAGMAAGADQLLSGQAGPDGKQQQPETEGRERPQDLASGLPANGDRRRHRH